MDYVDSFKDEVDFYIYKHTKKGDLVVTQDMGLAIKKDVQSFHQEVQNLMTGMWRQFYTIDIFLQNYAEEEPLQKVQSLLQTRIASNFCILYKKILSNHEGIL